MAYRARWWGIAALLVALVLAGCGGDEETAPQLVGPSVTRTPVPTESPDAGAAPGAVTIAAEVDSTQLSRGMAWDIHWPDDALVITGATGTWTTDLAGEPVLADPEVAFLAFSPDGVRIVARDADGAVTLRDAGSGETVAALNEDARYFTATFSADGARLAALIGQGTEDTAASSPGAWSVPEGTVREVDAATGDVLAEYEVPELLVLDLAYTPDGTLLLAGTGSNAFQFVPDALGTGPEVNPASLDLDVRLWDLAAGEPVTTITDAEGPMTRAVLSPDGSRLAGMSTKIDQGTFAMLADTLTAVWDVPGGQRAYALDIDRQDRASLLAISPDGARLAVAVNESGARTSGVSTVIGRVDILDLASGEVLRSLTADPLQTGFGEAFRALVFDPTGERLAALATSGTVVVWDVAGGDVLHTLDAFNYAASSLIYSEDSAILASAGMDGTIQVWDATSGERQTTIYTPLARMNLVFDPAGMLTATGRDVLIVQRWDPATGQMLASPGGINARGSITMAFDPSGERVATASGGGTVSVHLMQTGEQDVILAPHQVSALAFSADGSRLLTGGMDGSILLWDLADRNSPLARLDGHTGAVTDLRFAGAETVLSASRYAVQSGASTYATPPRYTDPDRTLRRWDVGGAGGGAPILPAETLPLPGPDLPPADQAVSMGLDPALMGGALSPDFGWLAMADPDEGRTITVYDVASEEAIAALDGHGAYVTALAWSPDGARLASGDQNGVIMQWQIEVPE
jgi:WD40 repeat protein